MSRTLNVLTFLNDAIGRGERCALVAIADLIGSASRARGSLMAVTETGEWCGSLSSGCLEAALVGEARRVIASGTTEILRIGQGSPLIDLRLPCGGGLDLLIVPEPDSRAISLAVASLLRRRAVMLHLTKNGRVTCAQADCQAIAIWDGEELVVRCNPSLRLHIVGHGDETAALARLAIAHGAEVFVHTPDVRLLECCRALGCEVALMKTPGDCSMLSPDLFSAAIVLFHDHDWEVEPLMRLLAKPCFLIGAMGSPQTHSTRLKALRDAGADAAAMARIVGPVGLIPSTRDPEMLALSVLAQVGAAWNEANRRGFATGI